LPPGQSIQLVVVERREARCRAGPLRRDDLIPTSGNPCPSFVIDPMVVPSVDHAPIADGKKDRDRPNLERVFCTSTADKLFLSCGIVVFRFPPRKLMGDRPGPADHQMPTITGKVFFLA